MICAIAIAATTNAIIQDACQQGSDAECIAYGDGMCCAYIDYTFKGDHQKFHACASRVGIEWVEGKIYDSAGFAGTWYCDGAVSLASGALALLTATAFNV